jgi:hypothetical protein
MFVICSVLTPSVAWNERMISECWLEEDTGRRRYDPLFIPIFTEASNE